MTGVTSEVMMLTLGLSWIAVVTVLLVAMVFGSRAARTEEQTHELDRELSELLSDEALVREARERVRVLKRQRERRSSRPETG